MPTKPTHFYSSCMQVLYMYLLYLKVIASHAMYYMNEQMRKTKQMKCYAKVSKIFRNNIIFFKWNNKI